MKKRFSEEQIVAILKEAESGGGPVTEICRKHNITGHTFYEWRKKYAGMKSDDIREMKRLREENNRLRKLVSDRDLEIDALKDVLSRNW